MCKKSILLHRIHIQIDGCAIINRLLTQQQNKSCMHDLEKTYNYFSVMNGDWVKSEFNHVNVSLSYTEFFVQKWLQNSTSIM